MMEPFLVSGWPEGFVPTEGTIKAFDAAEVNRRLSSTAIPLQNTAGRLEVYAERERYWLIDDRWGMAEINLLKNHWRAWILPSPSIDPVAVAEMAAMWPMAQLLRSKGLYLLPAIAVARDHWGLMLISPFGIQAELKSLVRAGFKVIGQQWTALREEEGRIAMLHVPGRIERGGSRRIRSLTSLAAGPSEWTDLAAEIPGITQFHSFCDAVIFVENGRRPEAWVRPIASGSAQAAARRHWRRQSFYRTLNRLLFLGAPPEQRVSVFASFYTHPPADIARFYAGRLSWADKLRTLRRGAPTVDSLPALRAVFRSRWA